MRHLPNFITSLNLTSGFAALVFAAGGDLITASWLIALAMIFDFLDGFSARALKAYSAIGKELDSLADIVSFGVAPGMIIFRLLSQSSVPEGTGDLLAEGLKLLPVIVVSALMPVCAALRLAIFNLDESQARSFKGLPTPANALAVTSVIVAINYSSAPVFSTFAASPGAIIIFTIILSLLMVSRLPLLSLKVSDLRFRGNEGRFIMVGLIIVAFAFLGLTAAPLIIPIYIVSSLINLLF